MQNNINKIQCEVKIEGRDDTALVEALETVLEKVKRGDTSGFEMNNNCGAYMFTVSGG